MKHRVAGRKLGRTSAHRLSLLRNLSTSLFDKERIRTTLGKAKELRPFAEKLVTLSKRETLHARRLVLRHIHDEKVVAKMFDTLSARYAQRPGGYTRILHLGPRRGDLAEMAIVELVDGEGADKPARKGRGKGKEAAGKERTAASRKAASKKATRKASSKKEEPAAEGKPRRRRKAAEEPASGKRGKKGTSE